MDAEAVFASLSADIRLLSREDLSRLLQENGADPIPDDTPEPISAGGYWIQPVNALALICPLGTPGGEDLLRLAASLLAKTESTVSRDSLWINLLSGGKRPADGEEEKLSKALQAEIALPRAILLISAPEDRTDSLQDILPLSEQDVLLHMEPCNVLIKDITDLESADDIREYALAIRETISDETGFSVQIGISHRAERLSDLPECYLQALQAIRMGERFHPDKNGIYLYDRMPVERILSAVPEEEARRLSAEFFSRKSLRLLDEEMIETVETFMDRDLSLSDTARQLYIHRNTLVYRLDKIQKATGLDLRSFRDAVTFYLLMKLYLRK